MNQNKSLGQYTGLKIHINDDLDKNNITNQIEAVIAAVVERSSFIVSEGAKEAQVLAMLENFKQQLAPSGLSFEEYLKQSEKTYEQLFNELKVIAAEVIKKDAALSAVTQAEAITVNDNDLRGKIDDFARISGCHPEQMYQELKKNGKLEAVYKEILWEKVTGFLLKNNCFV